jgi:hypothetical protein
MKFSKLSLLATLYTLLLISSSLISCSEKIQYSRHHSHRSLNTHKRNGSNKKTQPSPLPRALQNNADYSTECYTEHPSKFDFIAFIFAAFTTATSSVSSDIVNTLKKATHLDQFSEECIALFKKEYDNNLQKIKIEDNLAGKVQVRIKNFDHVLESLGESQEEKSDLLAAKGNTQKLCKISVKISERQTKEYTKLKKAGKDVLILLDKAIDEKWNASKLKAKSHEFFGHFEKKYLWDFMLNIYDPAKTDDENLKIAKEVITESYMQARSSKADIKNAKHAHCSRLPESDKDFSKCLRVGYAASATAFWRLLKQSTHAGELRNCVLLMVADNILTYLAGMAVEAVVTYVTDVFGFCAVRILKLVYYAIKLVYYIYKAVSEMRKVNPDVSIYSSRWGQAVGTVVRIVITATGGIRKRKFK